MEIKDLIGMVIGLIAVTGGLGIGFVAVWISVKTASQEKITQMETRNKERLALIEKGLDPTLFDKKPEKNPGSGALLWGLVLAGLGIGAMAGIFLGEASGGSGIGHFESACALLCGGMGLVIYYFIQRAQKGNHA